MKKLLILVPLLLCGLVAVADDVVQADIVSKPTDALPIKVARLVPGNAARMNYPNSLTTLLIELNKKTTTKFDPQPVIISSFESVEIFNYPFIFVNYADREDWTLSSLEKKNLKAYLDRGGFLYLDAGITTEFLRKKSSHGQHHSFADWSISPDLKKQFTSMYPDKHFQPLKNSHDIFKCFYSGLPDASELPETVRDFVVNEKWPDGTYSAVALYVNNRIAVLATPIISMGWGRNALGQWQSTISFRVRESAEGLSNSLKSAAYGGDSYAAVKKDGRKDFIFCQKEATPAWVEEPGGKWRVFRYYHSSEINEFAHDFYSRLGMNILLYSMMN